MTTCLRIILPCLLLAASDAFSATHAEKMKAGLALFSSKIRPALNDQCLKCHGGEKTRAGLNLASRAGLLAGGDSGPAIDLSAPKSSLVLKLMRHEEEPLMPAKEPKLAPALVSAFEQWIGLGAPYDRPLVEGADAKTALTVTDSDRDFWAFRPLSRVAPPKIEDSWVRNEIDRFILAKQREAGLTPNAPADKRTLGRRAFLDLLGLPPSPEEMAAFLADSTPQAWENLIGRLLDSPHFGERQARYWMDVARFAESFGFEQNYDRPHAYHYRDFLIQAFNADMPWDQFVSWQLAGDELAPDDRLAWMATGFLVAGVFPTQITEAEFEQARYDELDDMLGTTGAAFLGLSIGCARCHDHKYDPIPTADYYQLAASFATAIRSERTMEFNPEVFAAKMTPWRKKRDELQAELTRYEETTVDPGFAAWLENPSGLDEVATESAWRVLNPEKVASSGGATLTRQPDGSWLASGKSPKFDEYTVTADVAAGAAALRIEALTHDSLPRKGPGRAGNGNFALGDLKIAAQTGSAKPVAVKLVGARATHEQDQGSLAVKSSIDGNRDKTGWAVDRGGIGKDQAAIFAFETPLAADAKLTITMRFHLNTQHTFGRFRLAVSANSGADFDLGNGGSQHLMAAVAKLKAGSTGSTVLTKPQRAALRDWFSNRDEKWRERKTALGTHLAAEPAPDMKPVMICSEGVTPMKNHADGRGYPHFYPQVHHLHRGDPKQKQTVAEQGFLQVLMPDKDASPRWKRNQPDGAGTSHRRAALRWRLDRHGNRRGASPRAGHRQPRLAAALRPRDCGHAERFRLPRRVADASGIARLAGARSHPARLAAQAAAPAHHAERRLTSSRQATIPPTRRRILTTICGGASNPAGWKRSPSAIRSSRFPACSTARNLARVRRARRCAGAASISPSGAENCRT